MNGFISLAAALNIVLGVLGVASGLYTRSATTMALGVGLLLIGVLLAEAAKRVPV